MTCKESWDSERKYTETVGNRRSNKDEDFVALSATFSTEYLGERIGSRDWIGRYKSDEDSHNMLIKRQPM
uniref:Uncharacterized protein n=1 Tax=Setaria digitata TaxID=48799 RepID=A0A915Q1R6_9BILA